VRNADLCPVEGQMALSLAIDGVQAYSFTAWSGGCRGRFSARLALSIIILVR
jgi:hypothetical protein